MIQLQLQKDLSRDIKRGHPWVFKGALKTPLPKQSGFAKLSDKKGQFLAWGVYDAGSVLSFRVVHMNKKPVNPESLKTQWEKVFHSKRRLFDPKHTNGIRWIFGEGDGFPGLICDQFGDVAVLQTDGVELHTVWDLEWFAKVLKEDLKVSSVIFKPQKSKGEPRVILGEPPPESVDFLENGIGWSADVWKGQKTGFFLDQRNNRSLVRKISQGRSVLNLFSYTGGFSVSAGKGGASDVTSVDISKYAIESCERHWELNGLSSEGHSGHAMDVFDFLVRNKNKYDLVVVDPPSFASSKTHLEKAQGSYIKIFSEAAKVVAPGGQLALSSCSSPVNFEMFYEIAIQSLSKARRRGRVICIQGQPEDHPFPLVCPELRYLKFFLLQLD